MIHPLIELIQCRREGQKKGIFSICSANEFVIKAAMTRAKHRGTDVLIEATANQVNQFGGYTGMMPEDFRGFVFALAGETDFPAEKIILGGDHLGPLTWKNENEKEAMAKAEELVSRYVRAGFTKIHLDTSMPMADDDMSVQLDGKIIARRGARLAQAAELAFMDVLKTNPGALHPVYVVGSEVPIPGGVSEEKGLQITRPEDFEKTVACFQEAFMEQGLSEAFQHVVAIVVQPGVEFGSNSVHHYDRRAAAELCQALEKYPALVFEGHSTDYQTRNALKQMVEDGIAILKVGPALTFSVREGIFMLCLIEKELFHGMPEQQSYFMEILESVMLEEPGSWRPYYHGDDEEMRRSRKYGLSDRSRYYLTHPRVKAALGTLISNLSRCEIPLSLISQYLPLQYEGIREGRIPNTPQAMLIDKVCGLLDDYCFAVNG